MALRSAQRLLCAAPLACAMRPPSRSRPALLLWLCFADTTWSGRSRGTTRACAGGRVGVGVLTVLTCPALFVSCFVCVLLCVCPALFVSCFVCAGTGQTAYEKHVAERAAMGVVPKPISAAQCSDLVKLLETPPKGEEEFLLNLLTHRVPPGVDEAAYVKADFLTAIVTGKTKSPLIDAKHAVKLLGTMQGGYNVQTLIDALDTDSLAPTAAEVCFLNTFFLCHPCLACVGTLSAACFNFVSRAFLALSSTISLLPRCRISYHVDHVDWVGPWMGGLGA